MNCKNCKKLGYTFRKLFNCLINQSLLFKLKHYFGINGNVFKCFTSYLNNRTSAVVINYICSTKRFLLFGVPPGSILGY